MKSPENSERQAVPTIDWPKVLEQNQSWIRTVVRSRIREPQVVEDILQDIALAALRQAPLLAPAKISPWLYRVAVKQCLMYRRRMGRHRKLMLRYSDRPAHEPAADPLLTLIHDEQNELVRCALDELPDLDRQILLLKHAERWKYKQLADHLGVTVAAVEYRLLRARKLLRSLLEQLQLIEVS